MRTAFLLLLICSGLLAGCGGMPKPRVNAQTPVADQTLARMAIVATNYDRTWDADNVRLRGFQIWLNRDGQPVKRDPLFEQPYDGKAGAARGSIKMKDVDGRSTNWVYLTFEIISGENPTSESISAATTVEWYIPGNLENKDTTFVAFISRRGRNSYAIDVMYVMDPSTGEMEQLLPSNRQS